MSDANNGGNAGNNNGGGGGGGGGMGMGLILGALVVIVAVIGFFVFSGQQPEAPSIPEQVDVNVNLPEAPSVPTPEAPAPTG